jgi:hypothetical protein
MPSFKVAQLTVKNETMIIVPVAPSFLLLVRTDQDSLMSELQKRANAAGILGNVVPVWDIGGGKMGFRAPPNQHPIFQQISLATIRKNVDKEVYW